MKSISAVVAMAAVLCVSSMAYGQGQNRMSTQLQPKKRVSVELMAAPMLLKGFGLGVGYTLTPKLQAELNYQQYTLGTDDKAILSSFRVTSDFNVIAVRSNFYPLASVDAGGWYVGASVAQVNLKSKTSSIYFGEGSADDSQVGVQGYTGYTFRGGLLRAASMLVRLGLGYGNGGAAETRTSTATGTKTEIKNATLIDLNVGMMF
jgi:hypothetical protein